MNTTSITFSANEQKLKKTEGLENYASNTVGYIKAVFTLGENWSGYDSVRAVWSSYYDKIATVLDAENSCIVPTEMMLHKSKVYVNLVGSIVDDDELTDRLTTARILALTINNDAEVSGSETTPVTPSQFEQFVSQIQDEAEQIENYSADSEAWAIGKRNGVDVGSTDPTYHNNSKYYADQGAALSQEVSDLKSDLSEIAFVRENVGAFVDEKFIVSNADVGSTVSLTPTFSADWEYLIVDCVQGDRFYADETGANTARAWAFIDSNNVMLAKSESGLIKDIIIAPQNTAKVIFNNKKTAYTKSVYKVIGDNKAEEAYTKVDELGIEHFNLYTGINNTLNYFIDSSNGALSSNSSFQTSDFIDVSAYQNQTIKVSYSFSGAFYDSSKTFVASSGFGRSDESYSDLELSVPATAKYVRVSVSNTKTDKLQVGKNVSRQNYVPYANYSLDDLVVEFSQIKGTEGLFVNNNLFDSNAITTGKYISGTTGNPNNLSGYNASDFIDIGASNYVTVSGAWNAVVFKSDKSYSREITRLYDDYPLTALLTSAEKYIRITVKDANLAKAKVEVNMGESVFVDYGLALDSAKQVDSAYKMTTIYVGAGCYFTTINSALTAIINNGVKNRYTLFITEGEYNETITTKDYVDIVGESKYKSIINYVSDDESDYVNRSAIFASTYTILKNLTVRTTGSKYPLHCDARYNEPYDLKAENCIFQHDGFSGDTQPAGTAVGIGLYHGQHVTLEMCECIGSGVTGVASVYCHNSSESDASHSRFRSLKIKDCILSNATYGLRLQAIESNQLQANECVYIGNKNMATTPVSVEANTYQSWRVVSIGNTPEYTQS